MYNIQQLISGPLIVKKALTWGSVLFRKDLNLPPYQPHAGSHFPFFPKPTTSPHATSDTHALFIPIGPM